MKSISFTRSFVRLVATASLLLAGPAFAQNTPATSASDPVLSGTIAKMTWPEVEQAAKNGAIVLLPIGIVEEHGPHLDLTPDIYLSAEMCRAMKAHLEKLGTAAVIAPPYYWGISRTTDGFPGTFTVRPETMKAMLTDIAACLKNWGFNTVFFVNGHGDPTHGKVIEEAAVEIRQANGINAHALSALKPKGFSRPAHPPRPPGSYRPDYHAGAVETALMWQLYPAAVRPAVARELKPQPEFQPLGYVGNPAAFEQEADLVSTFLNGFAETEARRILAFLGESRAGAGSRGE